MSQNEFKKYKTLLNKCFLKKMDINMYKTKTRCLPIILYKIQMRNGSKPLKSYLKLLYFQGQVREISQDL